MRYALVTLTLVLFASCSSTPGAEELPPPERDTDRSTVAVSTTESLPASELEVDELELEGVRGGRITLDLDGDVEQVLAMLLDFEHADGKRAWAKTYELLLREPTGATARWHFEGKMGVNPTCDLVFEVTRDDRGIAIRYRQVKPVFGLAAFFGDYRIERHPDDPTRTLLTERVYIDSGLWIANASAEDIRDGLREDAERMRAWMKERLTPPAPQTTAPIVE